MNGCWVDRRKIEKLSWEGFLEEVTSKRKDKGRDLGSECKTG